MTHLKSIPLALVIIASQTVGACSAGAFDLSSDVNRFVKFPTECTPTAADLIEQGVSQLHHMMYVDARHLFEKAQKSDPTCAIAVWGETMTHIHPIWPDRPSAEVLSHGDALVKKSQSIGGKSERENLYIATAAAYFSGATTTEADRLTQFERAWEDLYSQYPDDQEAKAFYVLSQLATVDKTDKNYADRIEAGGMAEDLLKLVPNHPGAQHYIIHAYDVPGLAERALPVARTYGVTAPKVPHALHMMSHIFIRRGLWDESILWNQRSADAAWIMAENQGAVSMHYVHALDYLVYAHLQKGQDKAALDIIKTMAGLEAPYNELNRPSQAYALAAPPSRYALERQDWEAAASLEPRMPVSFPWEEGLAPYIAHTHLARGLGLAHTGRFAEARREIETLEELRQQTESQSPYWATQIEIQRMIVQAWTQFLNGEKSVGLALMKKAVALEATMEKSPTTPGEILPASELLGDMLVELDQHGDAVEAYRAVLTRSPGRLNSLFGLARSLEKVGDSKAARICYSEIVALTSEKSSRPSIVFARNF